MLIAVAEEWPVQSAACMCSSISRYSYSYNAVANNICVRSALAKVIGRLEAQAAATHIFYHPYIGRNLSSGMPDSKFQRLVDRSWMRRIVCKWLFTCNVCNIIIIWNYDNWAIFIQLNEVTFSQDAAILSCKDGCNIAIQFPPLSSSPTTINTTDEEILYRVSITLFPYTATSLIDSAKVDDVYAIQVQDQFGNETLFALVKKLIITTPIIEAVIILIQMSRYSLQAIFPCWN